MLLVAFSLLSCVDDETKAPEKVSGQWELYQVETQGGQVEGLDAVLARYPDCIWGRMTWTFEADHIQVAQDVLCPASPANDDFYGCQVSVRVPAVWDDQVGKWTVGSPMNAKSRTIGLADGALPVPTVCQVGIGAGDFAVVKVRGEKWKWQMINPDGTVYRLRTPDSERPDFVAALSAHRKQEAP